LIARGEPQRFGPLLSLSTIDRFLATTSPCHPDVFLVDAARKLSAEDYTLADPDGAGQLDLPRAYELFRTDATISMRRLHESLPELGALCRAVEKGVQQALSDQYLPIASKMWTLYDTLIELPLHGQVFDKTKHQPSPPTREITIRAGDLFYCPRGLFHSARSTEETSPTSRWA
jgi:JmjC domain